MAKSLRWRLQAWHALILLLVIAGFGSVLFVEVRRNRMDEIDAELLGAARVLEGSLRGLPHPVLQGEYDPRLAEGSPTGDGYDSRRPPPPGEGPDFRRPPPPGERPDFRPPPPDEGPDSRPPPPGPRPEEHLERGVSLPMSFEERFASLAQPPYLVIWYSSGGVLKASPSVRDDLPPAEPDLNPEQSRSRQRGQLREVLIAGPEGTRILVGRSIERETAGLARLTWQLVLTGIGLFAVGLVGGWWLSGRAVAPIATMSTTAASISASNLSQRIDVAGVDDELGELGQVLNAMFARLEAAFTQQIRFTADASHELRTPLAVLLTHIELALSRPRSPEAYRESLGTCLRAVQRMQSLAEGLLMLARADAGKLELRRGRVDLRKVVQESVSLLGALPKQHGIRIQLDLHPAEVIGDPDRLGQVVTNLTANAIQYNRTGGQVTLTTGRDGGQAVLTVRDTGVGIPHEHLPHIFDRFYRVDKVRSRERGGSGLGLAICKSILDAHDGTITVESAAGVGATFTVRLPGVRLGQDGSQQIQLGDRKIDDDAGDIDERGHERAGSNARIDAQAAEHQGQHRADQGTPYTDRKY